MPVELSEAAAAAMLESGFNSKAEYVRSLMRADVERRAHDRLEAKLVRAMQRSNLKEATPEFWEAVREEVLGSD